MYPQVHFSPKSNTILFTQFSAEDGIWLASDNEANLWDGSAIGEGKTAEDARADFWGCIHGYDKTACLIEPTLCEDRWSLRTGCRVAYFDTREEAVAFAEKHEYLL